jgi:mannose-6-phosphate isomerase-like protein (cupin superfamily)
MRVVDLAETFGRFADAWSPKIVGDVNDMHVKVVKLRGEFVWHHHDAEDELFLVVAGRLRMQLRDGDREVGPGQFIIVQGTLNTGDVMNQRTVDTLERL